ncbi:MAG TPA: tetratricopeptide repeat protein [Chroococcales cyanobacterium]
MSTGSKKLASLLLAVSLGPLFAYSPVSAAPEAKPAAGASHSAVKAQSGVPATKSDEPAARSESESTDPVDTSDTAAVKSKVEEVREKASGSDTDSTENAEATPNHSKLSPAEKLKAAEAEEAAAAEAASKASALAAAESTAHYDQSQFYFRKWDFKMAALEIQAAIMYSPKEKAYHRDYCVDALLTGDFKRSLAEFMMVVGLGEAIPFNEDERIAFNKEAAKMHYRKGIAWGRKYAWKDAIAEFNWALKYAPNNATIERSLAFSYATTGDFKRAEDCYATSFTQDPSDGFSHADFAYILEDNGEKAKAFEQLAEAVKLEPDSAALHVDMGWLAESKGDLSTARDEFRHAIKLSPKHAGLWAHLGKVLENEGKTERAKKEFEEMHSAFAEARKAYSEALTLDPSQDDVRKKLEELKSEDGAEGEGGSSSKASPVRDLRES